MKGYPQRVTPLILNRMQRKILGALRLYWRTGSSVAEFSQMFKKDRSQVSRNFMILYAMGLIKITDTLHANQGGPRDFFKLSYPCLRIEMWDMKQVAHLLFGMRIIKENILKEYYMDHIDDFFYNDIEPNNIVIEDNIQYRDNNGSPPFRKQKS